MTLRATIESDATAVFTSTDDFAEEVTYQPDGGSSRAIDAVVIRESVQPYGEATILPVWQVHVANDSTNGIASDEINVGRDQIALPPRDGETAVSKTITMIVLQDHGMLVVECR